MSPNSSVKLGLIRDGKEQTINVPLAQMPNQQQAQAGAGQQEEQGSSQSSPRLGLSLAPARASGAGNEGVVVTAVDPNGPAAEQGIKAGDVIVNVAGTSVSTPGDVQKQLAQLQKTGKHSVLMRVKSGDATHYVALPLATG
jgi:serine protease Do